MSLLQDINIWLHRKFSEMFVTDQKGHTSVRTLTTIDIDNPTHDAFGKLRVSQAVDLYNNKNIYNIDGFVFKEKLVGAATLTYNSNEIAKELRTTNAAGDRVVRQSPHVPYIPSKSQVAVLTGVIGIDPKENSVRRCGIFDDDNGLFFELDGNIISVVRRTSTSGSPVEDRVNQSDWNIDKMDGTGPSGIVLDLTKTQIFEIDYQWLGVGRVRFALVINGMYYPIHYMNHANILPVVYMSFSSLPIRYELLNKGVTSGNSILNEICSSISSEGAFSITGAGFAIPSGFFTVGTTKTPILAIRLKNTFFDKKNWYECILELIDYYTSAQVTTFYVDKIINPTVVTSTWTSVNNFSACEYSAGANIGTITGTVIPIGCTVLAALTQGSVRQSASGQESISTLNESRRIHQNIDSDNSDIFLISAQSLTSTTSTHVCASWLERI